MPGLCALAPGEGNGGIRFMGGCSLPLYLSDKLANTPGWGVISGFILPSFDSFA